MLNSKKPMPSSSWPKVMLPLPVAALAPSATSGGLAADSMAMLRLRRMIGITVFITMTSARGSRPSGAVLGATPGT
jgi:hypothetical protein